MKIYLSHGMGVNSTALMVLIEDMGFEFESVFVDTGVEHPETYEYLNYLKEQGYKITVLKPSVEGFDNLYDYCKHYKIVPGQFRRWCTDKFKIRTLRNYIEAPCVLLIGIDYGEQHRAFKKPIKQGCINAYPLIDYRIDRKGCIKIIEKHGLRVPRKSGCYICPFATKHEIRELYLKYRDLYNKRKEIEQLALERTNGKGGYLKYGKSTEEIAMENVPDILSFEEVIS